MGEPRGLGGKGRRFRRGVGGFGETTGGPKGWKVSRTEGEKKSLMGEGREKEE